MSEQDKMHLQELAALIGRREAQEFECAQRVEAIIEQSFHGVERTKTLIHQNFSRDPDHTCERLATKTTDLVLMDRYGPFKGKKFSIWPRERRAYQAAVANVRRLPGALRELQQAREDTQVAKRAHQQAQETAKIEQEQAGRLKQGREQTQQRSQQDEQSLNGHAQAQRDMIERYRKEDQTQQHAQAGGRRRFLKLF